MRKLKLLCDGCLGFRWFLVFYEGVCDIVLFFLEDQRLDDTELAEFAANIFFLNLKLDHSVLIC